MGHSSLKAASWKILIALGVMAGAAGPIAAPAQDWAKGRARPDASGRLRLVDFQTSPFPYNGEIPDKSRPFLDAISGDRKGHTSPRGGIYWEESTYSSHSVLLGIPATFDPARRPLIVVYFHGNQVKLDRDVRGRQQVPRQIAESGLNAVLVAPQFAVDALDSSAGHFWQRGAFREFLNEAARHLARMWGDEENAREAFATAPVILVAYSGGYLPAAFSLALGGVDDRIEGVILLDALYGETDKFISWITRRPNSFFVSAYSESTRTENLALQRALAAHQIAYESSLPRRVGVGTIAFIPAGANVVHNDFVTRAWVPDPLKVVLSRVPGYPSVDPFPTTPQVAARSGEPTANTGAEMPQPPMPRPRPQSGDPAALNSPAPTPMETEAPRSTDARDGETRTNGGMAVAQPPLSRPLPPGGDPITPGPPPRAAGTEAAPPGGARAGETKTEMGAAAVRPPTLYSRPPGDPVAPTPPAPTGRETEGRSPAAAGDPNLRSNYNSLFGSRWWPENSPQQPRDRTAASNTDPQRVAESSAEVVPETAVATILRAPLPRPRPASAPR
jgi:hypothetical protein